ncbi:MAG: SDR family oxidoreductase [Desulfovibrionaceae bacterium]|jgi:NAD(P)-dependent dehydrogenase (short-subunit alcohol dehydrogenase family)|nr:SDR family oxidoreductase [Desulfovibrionaceae bacterium]
MNDSLRGRRVVVVGGGSGIGLAVAARAAGEGAAVVIASRSAGQRHDALVAAIGRDIEAVALDVTSAAQTDAALEEVGGFDHLALCTRPEIAPAPFAETDAEQAKKAFETKFWGPYRLIQKAHRNIAPGGSIVLTTGIAGERIFPNHSTMAVINCATEALCRALAVELAPVRVNAVSPGFVAPKPPAVDAVAQRFPLGRVAAPEEVAAAYVHLMKSPYATGTTLVVDGGARLA